MLYGCGVTDAGRGPQPGWGVETPRPTLAGGSRLQRREPTCAANPTLARPLTSSRGAGRRGRGQARSEVKSQGARPPRQALPPHRPLPRLPPGQPARLPAGSAPPPLLGGPQAHPGRLCLRTGVSSHSGQTRYSASSPVAGPGSGADSQGQATHLPLGSLLPKLQCP